MIGDVFGWLDAVAATALPQMVRLVLWASVSGVLSMLLYAISSPQRRLAELKSQTADLNRQLVAYDGDFNGAMTLTQQNLRLSFHRLGLAVGPSLLAGAPVLLALFGLASVYENQEFFALGPSWARSWITGFLVVTSIAALTTKFACKID